MLWASFTYFFFFAYLFYVRLRFVFRFKEKLVEKIPTKHTTFFFRSVVKNGQIYIVGGISGFRPSDEHNALRVYSPNKDVWAEIQPPMSVLKGKVTAVLTK